VRALQRVGVPYTDQQIAGIAAQIDAQGMEITTRLGTMGIDTQPDREIVALIAYLQRLGRDGKAVLQGQTASAP
jgi:cytochrome c oxidase cbb3-type subunit I/II